jgi:hypothetical protein
LIEISRSLVRTFRTVLKKLVTVGGTREPATPVVFRAGRTGLHIQARKNPIALEYCQAGTYAAEEIAVPAEALAELEARKDTPLRLENNPSGVVATWMENNVPQIRHCGAVEPDRIPQLPELPTRMERQPVELLGALRDASETAGTDVTRYAVNCLQFRGAPGQVVSTDGRQLLAQSGFTFAWDDAVLIPASPVYGCRALPSQGPVALGRTDECVTLTIGAWTLHLVIEKNARFPIADTVLGGSWDARTQLQLDPGDVEFLLGNLASLPGAKDEHAPVTIEGNGHVIVRAQGTEQATPTEIVLARSSAQGPSICFASDRQHLAHALRLGFRRIGVAAADQPVLCREDKRQFMWKSLGTDSVLKSSVRAIRLSSADATEADATEAVTQVAAPASVPAPVATRKPETVAPKTRRVSDRPLAPVAPPIEAALREVAPREVAPREAALREVAPSGTDRVGITAVLAEAEAIKDLLHQAFSRTHQLVVSLKRYRRQAQAVRSALGSLRHLHEVAD